VSLGGTNADAVKILITASPPKIQQGVVVRKPNSRPSKNERQREAEKHPDTDSWPISAIAIPTPLGSTAAGKCC